MRPRLNITMRGSPMTAQYSADVTGTMQIMAAKLQ